MSLFIDVDEVKAVLLADGIWYAVKNESFDLDAYEFAHGKRKIGGTGDGFQFEDENGVVCGPLSSIVAVRT